MFAHGLDGHHESVSPFPHLIWELRMVSSVMKDGTAQGNGAIDLGRRGGDGFHDLVLNFCYSIRRGWGEACEVFLNL